MQVADKPFQTDEATERWIIEAGAYPMWLGELRSVVKNNRKASFAQVFMAAWISWDTSCSERERDLAADSYPRLLESFENTYGTIIDSSYGGPAAAVLLTRSDDPETTDERLMREWRQLAWDMDAFVWSESLDFDSTRATEVLTEILSLRDRITTFLPGETYEEASARDIALRRLYGLAERLVTSMGTEGTQASAKIDIRRYEDAKRRSTETNFTQTNGQPEMPDGVPLPSGFRSRRSYVKWIQRQRWFANYERLRPSEGFDRAVTSIQANVAKQETAYLGSLQRFAQRKYLKGVALGFVLLIPAALALGLATAIAGFDAAWLAAGIAGGIGAILSVLQRMGRGPLDLGPEGDGQTFMLQGLVRPVIGSVLGIASFVLIDGGLVSLVGSTATSDRVLYYAGIAFLAGFSERFAQDMLAGPSVAARPTTRNA